MRNRIGIAVAALWLVAVCAVIPVADALPGGGARIAGAEWIDERTVSLRVYSAAMDTEVRVDVLRPADTSQPRPTLYLLNGAGGGVGTKNWQTRAPEVLEFLGGQNVNVVQPVGGEGSYYADWRHPDPVLGVSKWKTFLTLELPPLIDTALGANGINAVVGVSANVTAALNLAIAEPGLFRAVATYSGCAQISDPFGQAVVRTVVELSGGSVANMYGPPDDPLWVENDPYVHAERLRGVELFVSSGSGLPGPYDTIGEYAPPLQMVGHFLVNGSTELVTAQCSRNLVDRLTGLGIPVTSDFPPGMHTWGYFRDAFLKSWPVLAKGLGLPVAD